MTDISPIFVLRVAALAAAVVIYYAWLVDKVSGFVSFPFLEEPLKRRFPGRHVDAACGLGYSGVLQACFFAVLVLAFRPAALDMRSMDCDPVLASLGLVLGIGEMGFSTLLGFATIVTIDTLLQWSGNEPTAGNLRGAASGTDWSVTARGGWMQCYIKAMTILPRPVGVTLVAFYVFFEEGVFRGVVLGSLIQLGVGPALAVSTALFMLVQTFHTAGWRTAIFPVIGALVLGIVNGALFLAVPKIVPIALAHASFFFSAMWSIRKLHPVARMRTFG